MYRLAINRKVVPTHTSGETAMSRSYFRIAGELWAILRYAISSPTDRLGGRLLTRLGKGGHSTAIQPEEFERQVA